jgi:hypothetical protein
MDIMLMGLEWENVAEYFTTYITRIFHFGTTSRGARISIIGGADIHIFVFCPINLF